MSETKIDALKRMWADMWGAIENMIGVKRQWDGSASRYNSTDEYCSACLIDVNSAAGRDTKAQAYCMLPVRDPGSDTDNFEGIQAAAGGRGITQVEKPDDVPQDAWDSAKKTAANRIISAYNAEDKTAPDSVYEIAGKEPPETERALSMSRMFERAARSIDAAYPEEWVYVHDIFQDAGNWFAIGSSNGYLYQYPLTVTESDVTVGERVQVTENFTPVMQTKVMRQSDGRYRWLTTSSTALVNKAGEIDSTALFDDFERQSQEPDFEWPYRCFYHMGEKFRTGQVDFIARWEYGLVTSGLFDDTPLGRAEVQARTKDPDGWRDSIHFVPTERADVLDVGEISIPVYRAGKFIEVSTAPAGDVCSYGTTQTMIEEVSRMQKGDRQYTALVQLFDGDEKQADEWLEQNPGAATRAVQEGAVARTDDTETPPEAEPQPEPVQREIEVDDELVGVIAEQVLASIGTQFAEFTATLDELARRVESASNERARATEALDARVAELERTDDERVDQIRQDMPRREAVRATYRPRDAHSREGADDDETFAERAERIKKESGQPDY